MLKTSAERMPGGYSGVVITRMGLPGLRSRERKGESKGKEE